MALMIALCLFTAEALDLMRTLKSESVTDPLSGLLNRRGWERASTMLGTCQSAGLPVSLIIADLDHFKAVNDPSGHAVGDRVIAAFAALLRTITGTHGVVGRLGGEEFAILLPVTDLAAARLFAEGVRMYSRERDPGCRAGQGHRQLRRRDRRRRGESLGPSSPRRQGALSRKTDGRDSVRVSYQRPPERPASPRGIARVTMAISLA